MIIKIESKLMEHTKENGTLGWNESDDDLKLHNLLVELNAPQRAITFQDNNPPTLGWCRENQKNILITIEPRRQIGDFLFKYTHYSYDISGQVNYNLDPLEDVKNGDLLNGKIWNPFLEIHLYSENALKQKLKQKLPFVTDKYNDYSHVKKRFKQFNTHCNKMPNFVLADYVDQGNPSKTIDEANDIINKHGCFKPELL
ncbi:unnamed protein product [Paramecium octaurelia]|uniref:Uncharacterized protein n=1 Tax=Paramecium octaurelia TaxID=43137 RepID=A0A8S1XQ33_PAROT|nr:unnamed protein product [Paramecium octaurelia]